MVALVCAMCCKQADRRSGEWYEGSERDLLLDRDETAIEDEGACAMEAVAGR